MKHCDFCNATPVMLHFDCDDFIFAEGPISRLGSLGGWSACAECARLILDKEYASVTERSVKAFITQEDPTADESQVRQHVTKLHGFVWQGLRGIAPTPAQELQ